MNLPPLGEILDVFSRYLALGVAIAFVPFFIIALTAALHGYPQGLAQ